MPEKEGDALCRHLAFYPAASERACQVQQILHYHILRKIVRTNIGKINKEITKL